MIFSTAGTGFTSLSEVQENLKLSHFAAIKNIKYLKLPVYKLTNSGKTEALRMIKCLWF